MCLPDRLRFRWRIAVFFLHGSNQFQLLLNQVFDQGNPLFVYMGQLFRKRNSGIVFLPEKAVSGNPQNFTNLFSKQEPFIET